MLKYNDLPIQSKNISCHQTQIVTKSSHSVLEDLIRSNGIYDRSQCVKKHRLRDGDIIMSGKHDVPYKDRRLSDSD
ncbi:MAG: FHA domain-containing protein [Gammaproteobacteria bacterium]